MFKTVAGRNGRLIYRYDVLTDFDGWVAIAHWDGTVDADDRRPGATLNVDRHYPDFLAWQYRDREGLKVELDIGVSTYEGEARILVEEPLLTIEIIGALERH